MRTVLSTLVITTFLLLAWACSSADRQQAHEKASELAHDAKAKAHQVASEIKTNDTAEAKAKLEHGETDLKRAALEAKVKAQLAHDLGANTLTDVSVSAVGTEVTLTGHVVSEEQKKTAENAASAVDGVTQVHNELTVAP